MSERERDDDAPDAAKVSMIAAAVFGALFSLAALVLFSARSAFSVAVGATIAVANLAALAVIIRAILRPPPEGEDEGGGSADEAGSQEAAADARESKEVGKRGGAAWGVFALLKMVFLFGGVWILLTRGLVDPIPLVVGYGVLPLGITASGLLTTLFPRTRRRRRSRK